MQHTSGTFRDVHIPYSSALPIGQAGCAPAQIHSPRRSVQRTGNLKAFTEPPLQSQVCEWMPKARGGLSAAFVASADFLIFKLVPFQCNTQPWVLPGCCNLKAKSWHRRAKCTGHLDMSLRHQWKLAHTETPLSQVLSKAGQLNVAANRASGVGLLATPSSNHCKQAIQSLACPLWGRILPSAHIGMLALLASQALLATLTAKSLPNTQAPELRQYRNATAI